jgi:hypothetical protein
MKRLILGLVLTGLTALAVPSSAPAANSYDFFVACDETAEPPVPSHECLTTDNMAAFFEATEETEYEVCLYLNETIDPLDCTSGEKAEAGTLKRNGLTFDPGDYEVVWFDLELDPEHEEIGIWKLKVSSPPPPPPPPPPPAPVVLPALPGLNPACLSAQRRVTRLKASVKKAHGHKKVKLKAKLKKARAAAKAAC